MGRRSALLAAAVAALASTTATAHAAPTEPIGTVTAVTELDRDLWIPETTAKGFKLTYVTTDARGRKALSTGELFVPKGTAPRGGWPVVSWAHGTSGLGDSCAPSVTGPPERARDFNYLRRWMEEGYAVVASDYAGLGTEGLPAYLHGRSEAHNVVDMVKAGRAYAQLRLGKAEQLSNRWVAIGQSQGGGAAIYTARYATEFGGPGLEYVGAVGTGTPAYIENAVNVLGPLAPPAPLTPGLTAYLTYIIASLDDVHPELGISRILTATGRKYVELAKTRCVDPDLEEDVKGVTIGSYFTTPLALLPNFRPTLDGYMKMPERGFDKPFFMGHGLADLDVPYAITAPYVAALQANGQPLTFRTYDTNHSGTVTQSQVDSLPFVRNLLAKAGVGPDVTPATKNAVRLARRVKLRTARTKGFQIRVTAPALTPVRITVRSRGKRVASGSATMSVDATATVRVRFTKAFVKQTRRSRSVRLRLQSAGAARTVTLRR